MHKVAAILAADEESPCHPLPMPRKSKPAVQSLSTLPWQVQCACSTLLGHYSDLPRPEMQHDCPLCCQMLLSMPILESGTFFLFSSRKGGGRSTIPNHIMQRSGSTFPSLLLSGTTFAFSSFHTTLAALTVAIAAALKSAATKG
eukprot:4657511-Ditylum_brightwellii.AAC.1